MVRSLRALSDYVRKEIRNNAPVSDDDIIRDKACDNTYTEGRELEPQHKHGLEGEVPGEVVENHPQCKALEKVERTKNNPVCQPLNVILCRRAFNRLE